MKIKNDLFSELVKIKDEIIKQIPLASNRYDEFETTKFDADFDEVSKKYQEHQEQYNRIRTEYFIFNQLKEMFENFLLANNINFQGLEKISQLPFKEQFKKYIFPKISLLLAKIERTQKYLGYFTDHDEIKRYLLSHMDELIEKICCGHDWSPIHQDFAIRLKKDQQLFEHREIHERQYPNLEQQLMLMVDEDERNKIRKLDTFSRGIYFERVKADVGQCDEFTAIALVKIFQRQLITKEVTLEKISIAYLDDDRSYADGHVFLAVNRDPQSRLDDISSWGKDAILVDPWNKLVCFAKDFDSLPLHYFSFPKSIIFEGEIHCAKWMVLKFSHDDYKMLQNLSKLDNYYTLTGHNNVVDRENALIEEYELVSLDAPQFFNSNNFVKSLLKPLLPNNFTQEVKLYLTMWGEEFVTPIAGFSQATIAIHKDFLCGIKQGGKYTVEELEFGLAVALYQIKFNPFNNNSTENQYQIDELALEKSRNGDAAVSYLQKSIPFVKEHRINEDEGNRIFKLESFTNPFTIKTYLTLRIKNILAKLAQQNFNKVTPQQIEEPFREINTAQKNEFFNTREYNSSDSKVTKINYLKSRLAELKIELFPYEATQQPSVRLREFCQLLINLKIDLNVPEEALAVDELINAAFGLEIPGFECVYRAVFNADRRMTRYHRDLPPLGIMKEYQRAISDFVNAKDFSQALTASQVLLKYQSNLKNHFMYTDSHELLNIKKLCDSGNRFFCSSIGAEIDWQIFPYTPIKSIYRTGEYLNILNKAKPSSYVFLCSFPFELFFINSNKEQIKVEFNAIPGLPEVIKKGENYDIAADACYVISSHLLELRGNLPWDNHVSWADHDQSRSIADALWNIGVVRDQRLWRIFSEDQLKQKINLPQIYNDHTSSQYNDNYVFPTVKLAGDLARYGDDYRYIQTNWQLIRSFSEQHQFKMDIFKDANKFEDIFCQFYDANLSMLIYPDDYKSTNNPVVHFLLNKFTEIALQGNEEDRKVVKSFFLGRVDKRDLTNLQGSGVHSSGPLKDDSPYLEFFLYQRYKDTNFTLFTLEERLKLFQVIKFNKGLLSAEYFISLFNFPLKSEFDIDCLKKLVALLKKWDLDLSSFLLGSRNILKVVDYHLSYHKSYELFSKQTAKLMGFLLQHLTYPYDGEVRNKIFRSIEGNSTIELSSLTCEELITIYYAHDLYLKFRSYDQQRHFGNIILEKLNALPKEDQIKMAEKLLFVSSKLYSMPLNDIQLRNELVFIWKENILSKFGKDTNSDQYIAEMKIVIDRVHANANSRDVEYILSQLANTILAQNKLSEHIGMLLEPEKYIVNDKELETILVMSKSNNRKKEWLFKIIYILGQDYDDRMQLLEFLAYPLSESSLQTFAKYLISRNIAKQLISAILPENVQGSEEENLDCVLRLIYNMFWNCSLKNRAVLVDYLLIPANYVANEELIKTSYEQAFFYVGRKLFPNGGIFFKNENPDAIVVDDNENFALYFLMAYLEVSDKYMRPYLLAAMLVSSTITHATKARVGQKLVTLCEHLGPAYVKLAQAIHSYPDTPEEIREDLAGVKGRANPPTRWQLWRLINEVLIDDKDQIAYLGAVLGSASFNIAVEVHLKNNTDAVLLLLRENARKDTDVGFNQLHKTVEICQHQKMNSIREISMSLIDEAKDLSVLEMDRKAGDLQSEIAANLYHSLMEVKINNVNYNIVCFSSKTISSGEGYRFIERVYGTEYNDLPVQNSQDYALKKAIAKAVVSIELINILSGSYFDCDRHGNQLRVYVDHHTHTIQLGLYDFGEMAIKEPSTQDLKQLDRFIAMIPSLFFHQKPMAVTFSNYISEVKKEGHPTEYLMKIRKALLAIQDFQKYLTNDEIVEILKLIGSKNAIHPVIKNTYVTTLGQVGTMHFVFKVGQGFLDYMSSAKKSCSTFFSSKICLEIGKRKHIDEVDDHSLELPELKKSKKNVNPVTIDVNKVQVSPIIHLNLNYDITSAKTMNHGSS